MRVSVTALKRLALSVPLWALLTASAFPADVAVPNLLEMTKDAALEELKKAGLSYQLDTKNTCGPQLTVVSQQPPPGTPVPPGSHVIVGINVDAGIPVPPVEGQNIEAASAQVKGLGLVPVPVERYVEVGGGGFCEMGRDDLGVSPEVSKVTPAAGSYVCPNTEVVLSRDHEWAVTYFNLKKGELCP